MLTIELYNGIKIPAVGLGTFPMKGEECEEAIVGGLKNGYRLLDTAPSYANAEAVGNALKKSGIAREECFIISKVSNKQQKIGNIKKSLKEHLKYLNLDYLDLYLLHWPYPDIFVDSYMQMEELKSEGYVKNIGVSNFHEHHLEVLLQKVSVTPVVNEIELHPLLNQHKLVQYCSNKKINIISYSPFARMDNKLMSHPALNLVREELNKERINKINVPQIILRWNYQHGYVVIPKSSNSLRQCSNISIHDFELTVEQMKRIDDCNEDYRVRHNPDTADLDKL